MADFKTHLMGAALVSGALATAVAMTGTHSQAAIVGYFTLGVAGGLMPDIDSESSIPIRIAYRVISALVAMMLVFHFAERYSFVELIILAGASYALMRFVIFDLFLRYTVHRGLVHSIPSAAICGLLTIIIAGNFFGASTLNAWFCGVFMFIGFIVHLLLDELYSVDLLGRRFKRSFGSALTLGDRDNIPATAALYVAVCVLFIVTPSPEVFGQFLSDGRVYQQIFDRLLPQGIWFSGLI